MRQIFYDNYLETEEGEVRPIPTLSKEQIVGWVHTQVNNIAEEDTAVFLSPTPPTVALVASLVRLYHDGFTQKLELFVLLRKSTTKTKGTSNKKKYSRDADSDFEIYPLL